MPLILRDSFLSSFKSEGHQENVSVYVGKNSGASFVYISDPAKKTANVLAGCCGCISGWSHLWEHTGCTLDKVDFRTSAKRCLNLAPSSTSRFTPEIQANASTRDHYVEFHMNGCMSKPSILEQFGHLQHQFLGIQSNQAVQKNIVMREASAVRNEAARSLSAIPYVMGELSAMVDMRHHLGIKGTVIGHNVLGEGSYNNMSEFKDESTVMREMKHCADTMVPSRTSWVYHGPESLFSKEDFLKFAAETDGLLNYKDPEVSDAEFLKPLVKEEFVGALSRTVSLPHENGFNVVAHSFTGAMATSKEHISYALMPHLLKTAKQTLISQHAVSFFDSMFDHVGRRPQVITMYNVAMPGTEANVAGALLSMSSPQHITPALFESCKASLVEECTAWRSMPNLGNVLPDALGAHPCGALGVMTLFQREKHATELTYDTFMNLYRSQIYPRMQQSTTIHGISTSLLQNAHRDICETPYEFNEVQAAAQNSICEWDSPHVTVAGNTAFLVCRIAIRDKFNQSCISTNVNALSNKQFQCSVVPQFGMLQITVKTLMKDLPAATSALSNLWKSLPASLDQNKTEQIRMQMNSMYSNSTWCANKAIEKATIGPVSTSCTPSPTALTADMKKPMQVVYFLPRIITGGSKAQMMSLVKQSQNTLRSVVSYTSQPVIPPLCNSSGDCNGWNLNKKMHMDSTADVVHTIKVPCQNVQFRCVLPCDGMIKHRRDILALNVISQYLGGGWNSAGMQVMRRNLNHCYDYSSHLHMPTSEEDTMHITLQSEFRIDDYEKACADNKRFMDSVVSPRRDLDVGFTLKQWLQLQSSIEKSRADIPEYTIYAYFRNEALSLNSDKLLSELDSLKFEHVEQKLHNFENRKRFSVACTP